MGAPGRHVPQECHYSGEGRGIMYSPTALPTAGTDLHLIATFPSFNINSEYTYFGARRITLGYHSLLLIAESPEDWNLTFFFFFLYFTIRYLYGMIVNRHQKISHLFLKFPPFIRLVTNQNKNL